MPYKDPDDRRANKRKSNRKLYAEDPERREQERARCRAYAKVRVRPRTDEERRKQAARVRVYRAVKAGTLQRLPCERCGDENSQAHHEDYSRPLDVRWLCQRCHSFEHRKD